MFNYEAHVFQMADARLGVPKPKTFWMTAHQSRRSFAQCLRRRRGRRKLAQFIRLGSHEVNVWTLPPPGKNSLRSFAVEGAPSPARRT